MAEKVKAFRLKIAQRMVELKKQPSEMLFLVSLGEVVVGIVGTGFINCTQGLWNIFNILYMI